MDLCKEICSTLVQSITVHAVGSSWSEHCQVGQVLESHSQQMLAYLKYIVTVPLPNVQQEML